MAAGAHSWEDLRKQARQVENELDVKLVAYSKLGAGYASAPSVVPGDQQPLLSGDDQQVEKTEADIEACLTKLSTINERMCEFSASGAASSAAVTHTLQRHRDILQDYTQEFRRTKTALDASRDRQQLLGRSDDSSYKNGRLNRRLDHLLKENEHIRNSDRLIDEQIAIAMETREHLGSQRATFKAIQTRVNDLAHRFPMINSLVQRIQLRKRRDSLILGAVIGLCLIFFIWYLFG
ncbi:Golgi SNAP receptor complex member 1 [Amphibalanus amphitrite]|uniref:Golgi SNAP receptor complex member 1 n=1 Tax=Amphibalanus amphitrite TaxID=1232801 RepID=A0A6A4VVU4_AMPAM|nr:Golgi SNAP receptor complex member 1-like [Amphibalanus amphitrite]XP_043200409.1 Golgi SNAP receptor complex member 1-like [Amphibalanus amphitrite]XP_043200410.1 Golgi SNAP receptor complex member 1-like [Amphibalanus amphitrite]XP_043200411.1 Golgi SNAP receptor complex member 1-like [Amphibalanus amphitrite]XP_043200412.1 Golgi SNAP receptor complex member 1-like [Amphibalanus amphitrite]XP_043200413.1 Golgi SNAP receptor complex member 1-like [Amphibalanus amphitrite]XP_043228232.1 Go